MQHVVFHQRQAPFSDIALDVFEGRPSGTLCVGYREWPLDGFAGVYTRLVDQAVVSGGRRSRGLSPDPERVKSAAFLVNTLAQWLEVAECRVVNRAWAMASNGSKPYQSQEIARAGLLTPATVVTNEEEEVVEFARRHGRIVYKSISAVRSIVKEWRPGVGPPLSRIRHLPTQFQEYVPGVNLRVHVVGAEIFATEVATGAVDYRYASRDGLDVTMRPVGLPDEIAGQCLTLSRVLRLPFCGIDLKRTPDGRFYCFEVNPSPAYSYYQEETNQPISRALIRYLAAGPGSEGSPNACR